MNNHIADYSIHLMKMVSHLHRSIDAYRQPVVTKRMLQVAPRYMSSKFNYLVYLFKNQR